MAGEGVHAAGRASGLLTCPAFLPESPTAPFEVETPANPDTRRAPMSPPVAAHAARGRLDACEAPLAADPTDHAAALRTIAADIFVMTLGDDDDDSDDASSMTRQRHQNRGT